MDTIVLVFLQDCYKVIDSTKFKEYFKPINPYDTDQRVRFLKEYRGSKKYIQNPAVSYRDQGLVYPNLSIYERVRGLKYTCDLHISISLPKLLNGHSFEEISNGDLDKITNLLIKRLSDMGIAVNKEAVLSSVVQTIHYCANILFNSENEARMFLDRIHKCLLSEWFENNRKTYSNNGHAIRFHTDIFELIFYLKYYDILEKGKRSVDRRKTLQETQIAEKLNSQGKLPPLTRFEIRLNGLRSVKSHLKTVLGIEKDRWTFSEVFDYVKSRKLLRFYWNKIIEKPENNIILCQSHDRDICLKVDQEYKDEKIITIAEGMGLFYMLKSLGVRDTKAMIRLRHSRKTWYDKRRKIVTFAKRFMKPDETLINTVRDVLDNKPKQFNLPL